MATFYKQGPDPPPDQRITGKKVAAIKTHYEKLYKGKPGLGRKALWTASHEKELQCLESGDVGSEKEAIIYGDALETQNDFVAGKVLSMSAERGKHILGRVFSALPEEERKSLAHLITGQDEAPAGEPPNSDDDSSIADDATLVENCGTNNVAARADALLLEWDADDDIDVNSATREQGYDYDEDEDDVDANSAAREQGHANDEDGSLDDDGDYGDEDGGDDGDDGTIFEGSANEEGNEQEDEEDSDDSLLAVESHHDSETIVEEDPYILLNKDQLLAKAKDLGITGVRAGWKEQTIRAKLHEYHAAERL